MRFNSTRPLFLFSPFYCLPYFTLLLLGGPDDPSDLSSRAPSNWSRAQLTFFFVGISLYGGGGGGAKFFKKDCVRGVLSRLVVVWFLHMRLVGKHSISSLLLVICQVSLVYGENTKVSWGKAISRQRLFGQMWQ